MRNTQHVQSQRKGEKTVRSSKSVDEKQRKAEWVCENEYESKYCTKRQRSKRKGLKLLISMPVDSFDCPSPCLMLSPFSALCLLPPGSGQKWAWALIWALKSFGYQPSIALYLQPSVKGPPAAGRHSTSLQWPRGAGARTGDGLALALGLRCLAGQGGAHNCLFWCIGDCIPQNTQPLTSIRYLYRIIQSLSTHFNSCL